MIRIFACGAVLAMMLMACKKDFLDRQPLSQISPDNAFNSESEMRLYVRSFYNMIPGAEAVYNEDIDNIIKTSAPAEVLGTRVVPVSGGGWDWGELRNINFFLNNYSRGGLDTNISYKYVAVAKFFRAYFYFNKVARFGGVPWYSNVIEPNDSISLAKPRTARTIIMDSVLADVNFAIAHLGTTKAIAELTKWTALALKSRIGLFEGTFRKYHTEFNLPDADRFLRESAAASDAIITAAIYSIYKSTPDKAYNELFSSQTAIPAEIILARQFSESLQIFHNLNYYTITASYGRPGLEKKLVNSYLMKDGTAFTDIAGYDTMQFYRETQNRDPRLSQTIRTPGYLRIGGKAKLVPDFGASVTGYQVIKFVTDESHDSNNKSSNDMPIFRYAEVLLNYAEAMAELGTITQPDIDRSIKQLRDRVGMPNLNLAAANARPDPYLKAQYTHASASGLGVILEIRRERRIELVMESFRYNDLMRWKEGHLLADQFKGMYFPGTGRFDLDNDGKIDVVIYTGTKPGGDAGAQFYKLTSELYLDKQDKGGYIVVNRNINKSFNEDRDYLYPIPFQELLLNPNLKQNPNWK